MVLQESVYRWNMNAATGKDPDFGRTRMVAPIEGPPYYAMEVTPHFVNTQGGPRRNAKAQIVQVNGEVSAAVVQRGRTGFDPQLPVQFRRQHRGMPGFRQDRGEKRRGGGGLEIEDRIIFS